MSRYSRSDLIAWLETEGCELDVAGPTGIVFFDKAGTQFVIPDPANDGWLDVALVEDVLANRWVGVGQTRPTIY